MASNLTRRDCIAEVLALATFASSKGASAQVIQVWLTRIIFSAVYNGMRGLLVSSAIDAVTGDQKRLDARRLAESASAATQRVATTLEAGRSSLAAIAQQHRISGLGPGLGAGRLSALLSRAGDMPGTPVFERAFEVELRGRNNTNDPLDVVFELIFVGGSPHGESVIGSSFVGQLLVPPRGVVRLPHQVDRSGISGTVSIVPRLTTQSARPVEAIDFFPALHKVQLA